MLGQRCRRWSSSRPTLIQHVVFSVTSNWPWVPSLRHVAACSECRRPPLCLSRCPPYWSMCTLSPPDEQSAHGGVSGRAATHGGPLSECGWWTYLASRCHEALHDLPPSLSPETSRHNRVLPPDTSRHNNISTTLNNSSWYHLYHLKHHVIIGCYHLKHHVIITSLPPQISRHNNISTTWNITS